MLKGRNLISKWNVQKNFYHLDYLYFPKMTDYVYYKQWYKQSCSKLYKWSKMSRKSNLNDFEGARKNNYRTKENKYWCWIDTV